MVCESMYDGAGNELAVCETVDAIAPGALTFDDADERSFENSLQDCEAVTPSSTSSNVRSRHAATDPLAECLIRAGEAFDRDFSGRHAIPPVAITKVTTAFEVRGPWLVKAESNRGAAILRERDAVYRPEAMASPATFEAHPPRNLIAGCMSFDGELRAVPKHPGWLGASLAEPILPADGCSDLGPWLARRGVSWDNLTGRRFNAACNYHDYCYSRVRSPPLSQGMCDAAFRSTMRDACVDGARSMKRPAAKAAFRRICFARAEVYFEAVQALGAGAHEKSQGAVRSYLAWARKVVSGEDSTAFGLASRELTDTGVCQTWSPRRVRIPHIDRLRQ